jgi:hypothetical protein
MTHHFRLLAVSLAAAFAVSGAQAATVEVDFNTFYDTSTFFNRHDTETLGYTVAHLKITDLDSGGGVAGTLSFFDTAFPESSKGLSVDELWIEGSAKGAFSSPVAKATYYKRGFSKEGERFNYDIDFKSGFDEKKQANFTILGSGVNVASFLTADGKSLKGVMLEINGVGKPYSGFLGLNHNVHFTGEITTVPEPMTFALMGLGLVGIAGVARRRTSV